MIESVLCHLAGSDIYRGVGFKTGELEIAIDKPIPCFFCASVDTPLTYRATVLPSGFHGHHLACLDSHTFMDPLIGKPALSKLSGGHQSLIVAECRQPGEEMVSFLFQLN